MTKKMLTVVKSIIIGIQGMLLETKLHELHNINGNELLKPPLRTPPTITTQCKKYTFQTLQYIKRDSFNNCVLLFPIVGYPCI